MFVRFIPFIIKKAWYIITSYTVFVPLVLDYCLKKKMFAMSRVWFLKELTPAFTMSSHQRKLQCNWRAIICKFTLTHVWLSPVALIFPHWNSLLFLLSSIFKVMHLFEVSHLLVPLLCSLVWIVMHIPPTLTHPVSVPERKGDADVVIVHSSWINMVALNTSGTNNFVCGSFQLRWVNGGKSLE